MYGKGIDEIVERGTTGADNLWHWYFYQQDQNGNVTQLIDATGAVIEKYQYDAFGTPVIRNAASAVISGTAYGNRFLFTGREYAASFGYYEYRARAYHPRLGRFMSEDPKLFDAGDYNLFRYCHNDPLDRTDPMGLVDLNLAAPHTELHEWGVKLPDDQRTFTVVAHGNSRTIQNVSTFISPQQLFKLIKNDPNFQQAETVRLYSCNTGDLSGTKNPFAKVFSQISQKSVQAPSDVLWISDKGRVTGIAPKLLDEHRKPVLDEKGREIPDNRHPGAWIAFGAQRADDELSRKVNGRPIEGNPHFFFIQIVH